ncbi:MAG: type II toxin-antitoxin system Phd/YefM family antitoxin [Deltaproteobacteria bacterium]|nr:type II toxin-antitoxin system Phd/YefM family antitoxin [Deltaproteobacteria bacterium]
MKSVTVHEAKSTLSKLLVATENGEEIIVCRGDQPVARLVPFRPSTRKRPPVGEITSLPVTYSADCFAPLSGEEPSSWGLE